MINPNRWISNEIGVSSKEKLKGAIYTDPHTNSMSFADTLKIWFPNPPLQSKRRKRKLGTL